MVAHAHPLFAAVASMLLLLLLASCAPIYGTSRAPDGSPVARDCTYEMVGGSGYRCRRAGWF